MTGHSDQDSNPSNSHKSDKNEVPAPPKDDSSALSQLKHGSTEPSASTGEFPRPVQPPAGFMPPPPTPDQVSDRQPGDRAADKKLPIFARTILDLDACRQVVARMVSDKEVQVNQAMELKAPGQIKLPHPIEKYRLATPCSSNWDHMSGAERYRLCTECKLFLYDFSNLELPQAKALVLQREGSTESSFSEGRTASF